VGGVKDPDDVAFVKNGRGSTVRTEEDLHCERVKRVVRRQRGGRAVGGVGHVPDPVQGAEVIGGN
jgi:hypothetical protein